MESGGVRERERRGKGRERERERERERGREGEGERKRTQKETKLQPSSLHSAQLYSAHVQILKYLGLFLTAFAVAESVKYPA